MKKIVKFLAICLLSGVTSFSVTVAMNIFHVPSAPGIVDVKYTDFISITLTALGLMIAVLGFFVAAAGVIGWSAIESRLKSHSTEYVAKQLAKDGELRSELERLISQIAYSGIEGLKKPEAEERPYND